LNQWFDDAKKYLLAAGLVENETVFGKEGEMVSEVRSEGALLVEGSEKARSNPCLAFHSTQYLDHIYTLN
jgi:hypothetical protein